MTTHLTRRTFTASLTSLAATSLTRAQTSAHADVAAMDRAHILAAAKLALTQPIATISSIPAPNVPAQTFFSELPQDPDPTNSTPHRTAFRAHAVALRAFSATVATLTAAGILTHDETYALRAGRHLYAWFVDPATRMPPTFNTAVITDLLPLAELARALGFLPDTAALSPPDLNTTHAWLSTLQTFLNTQRYPLIVRDAKDHTASAWLLLSSAIARSLADEATLDANRHRFLKPTLRNQINALGAFPQEIKTAFPYRNTLFNFDTLAAAAQVLSTPFDNLWLAELEDGPGLRSVAAFLYPSIKDRDTWPFIADPQNFRALPGRRPALLFAGRAFNRPEYVETWRTTPLPDTTRLPEQIAASFPITQPLLFTARAPHGL